LALVPLGLCLYLLGLAITFNHQFAWRDTSRWAFVLAPLVGSISIGAATIWGGRKQTLRKVILTPGALIYQEDNVENNFQVPWKSLAYSLPFNKKQTVRTLLIATGDKTARIHDIFMPHFDKLAAEIRNRKTRAITAGGGAAGTTIESGKVGSIDPALLGRTQRRH
jgi:hypothetical protein